MDGLYSIFSWGSPVGVGIFLFLGCAGAAIFFWGLSCLNKQKS